MKENAMIRIRKHMIVVILHARQVKFVKEIERVLQVDIVVRHSMHHEEADVVLQGRHVRYGRINVSLWVILRGMHVAFGIDGIWKPVRQILRSCHAEFLTVEPPVRHGRDGHSILESLSAI